jgi:hypothetical protein
MSDGTNSEPALSSAPTTEGAQNLAPVSLAGANFISAVCPT